MKCLDSACEFLYSPFSRIEENENSALMSWALLGYLAGAVSLMLFVMMVKPFSISAFSLLVILSAALFSNFLFSGMVHLFLNFLGKNGDALKLFCATGIGDFIWGVLLPLGFWTRLGVLGPFSSFFIAAVLVVSFRVVAIGRIYRMNVLSAFMSLMLNYVLFPFVVFMFALYALVFALMSVF